jgi:hypothetical protein
MFRPLRCSLISFVLAHQYKQTSHSRQVRHNTDAVRKSAVFCRNEPNIPIVRPLNLFTRNKPVVVTVDREHFRRRLQVMN